MLNMGNSYVKREILEVVFLIGYIVLILGIFSLSFGFGLGGFERQEILEKNNFYIPYGIAFLIGLVALKVAGIFIFGKRHADKEGVVIHDPEQSPLGGLTILKNPFLLTFFSIILFSLIFWMFSNQQTFFNATPQYEQQFTTGADLFFSVYPASPSETLGALFVIGLFGLILGLLVMKNKISKAAFFVFFILGSTFLSMVYGIVNHWARYGFSEIAMTNVAVFWGAGGLITALTGSVIPFLFMHDLNNFFVKLSKLFSQDIVTFVTFTIIGILMLSFIFVFLRVRARKK